MERPENKRHKLEAAKRDLSKEPPTPDERLLIHQLWLEQRKYEQQQQQQLSSSLPFAGGGGGGGGGAAAAAATPNSNSTTTPTTTTTPTLTNRIAYPAETRLQAVKLCHPQERNIHSSIFGGFLMREAFELAFTNATLYLNARPYTLSSDDIAFRRPVPIGSILFLNSQVRACVCVYVGGGVQRGMVWCGVDGEPLLPSP